MITLIAKRKRKCEDSSRGMVLSALRGRIISRRILETSVVVSLGVIGLPALTAIAIGISVAVGRVTQEVGA